MYLRFRSVKPIVLAGFAAALLVILASWIHDRFFTARTLILGGSDLSVPRGEWRLLSEGLAVGNRSARRAVMISAAVDLLPASKFDLFRWDIDGLNRSDKVAINWVTSAAGGSSHSRVLTPDEIARSRVELAAESRWRGDIIGVGIAAELEKGRGLIVRRLELVGRDGAPTLFESFNSLVDRWRHSEPWSARSTNGYVGALDGVRWSPVGIVTVWLGLAASLLWVNRPVGLSLRSALVMLFLFGWLFLDLRWQRDLSLRANEKPQHPGLLLTDAQSASFDALVRQIPERTARIFVIHSSSQPNLDLKLRYHLAPHSVYTGLTAIPSSSMVRGGDYLLIAGSDQGVIFDPIRGVLFSGTDEIPADLIGASPTAGRLFHVRDGS